MTSDGQGAGNMSIGSYKEARGCIGAKSEVMCSPAEVSRALIRQYAAGIEDANPNYWDEEYTRLRWGAPIAPGGMLLRWIVPFEWHPGTPPDDNWQSGTPPDDKRLRWHIPLRCIPLPGLPADATLDVEIESEFFLPVKVGDWLSAQEELVDISPEKITSVGRGHFVTTVVVVRNQKDDVVGTVKTTNLRYKKKQEPERRQT